MKLNDEQYAHAEATDMAVPVLVALAEMTANQKRSEGFNVDIHFKHTCHNCRSRMMFEQPNTVYKEVECGECGHKEPFLKGGFSMVYKFNDPEENRGPVALDPHGVAGDTKEVIDERLAKSGGGQATIIDMETGETR